MPHVIVKLWPGKSERQKQWLADQITKDVMEVFDYGEESISITMEEVSPQKWREKFCNPDILDKRGNIYKKPSYDPDEL